MGEVYEAAVELEELQSQTDEEEDDQWESESLYADALDGVTDHELFKPCKLIPKMKLKTGQDLSQITQQKMHVALRKLQRSRDSYGSWEKISLSRKP